MMINKLLFQIEPVVWRSTILPQDKDWRVPGADGGNELIADEAELEEAAINGNAEAIVTHAGIWAGQRSLLLTEAGRYVLVSAKVSHIGSYVGTSRSKTNRAGYAVQICR